MKLKKLLICLCSAITLFSLCGCTNTDSEEDGNKNSNSETVESEKEPTAQAKINYKKDGIETPKIKTYEGYVDPVTGHPGVYIANGMSTGLNLHAPAGICIYNGDVYEERKIMMPEKIPTVSDLFIISDESGNNMNFFASASKTNRKDFENLKQKDVEKSFLDGAKNALEDAKVISYETDNYDGYPGIKMIVTSKMAGVDIEQTIIMINAVDLNDVGYSYTITYTDVSGGTLRDAIEESISTINFVNVSNLASQYSTPEELAEYQATKTNRNINNTPAVTTKNIPAPTVTAVEKDASFKDFLEEAGVVDEEYNEIMDMLENKDENTRTTLSKEEMRKKYLGE